jgi:hypothetical protein
MIDQLKDLLDSGLSLDEALDVLVEQDPVTAQPKPGEDDAVFVDRLKGSKSAKTMKTMMAANQDKAVDSPAVKRWQAHARTSW